ncbi:uncharacterized protein TRAVEDRAFT_47421 [Trametes versicolor FP-101664 SS1]|uniref:uncharacterized protein n=1 Tax=Trametes versicolor (strain FP-101664) TaxID=717944 RepID=UPI00046219EB|nr:uncharacterized protein TRAVEDRAFT_47421 [Trametes versicolor FP-101664 SS1]EIW58257.1 hypothetical protein TRAVEDRAFT_47421 [Trametes versicolor FP-101664 SS1]
MDHPFEKGSNLSFQRTQGRLTASTALWGHLLRKTGSSQVPPSSLASTSTLGKHTPAVAPIDKAGASTRILLHDTQAHLEKFTDRVALLTTGLDSAKRELIMAQKLYQDDHEQVIDKISGLANRCQTELQKSIGSPAQSTDVREVTKDLSHLSIKLEALDGKIDTLSSLNQMQSQALQVMQQQQSQLLAALVPILPLLQNVPVQIENARDRVKDSILELRQEALARDSSSRAIASGPGYTTGSRRSRARSSGPSASCDSTSTPTSRKRRRLDATLDGTENRPAKDVSSVDITMHAHPPPLDGPTVDQSIAPLASSDIPLARLSYCCDSWICYSYLAFRLFQVPNVSCYFHCYRSAYPYTPIASAIACAYNPPRSTL